MTDIMYRLNRHRLIGLSPNDPVLGTYYVKRSNLIRAENVKDFFRVRRSIAGCKQPDVPPPPPPDYSDALTRYFLRHNPAKVANVGGLLARYAGDEASLFAKIEAKYGAPVLSDNTQL